MLSFKNSFMKEIEFEKLLGKSLSNLENTISSDFENNIFWKKRILH